jgi:hypothetical protein
MRAAAARRLGLWLWLSANGPDGHVAEVEIAAAPAGERHSASTDGGLLLLPKLTTVARRRVRFRFRLAANSGLSRSHKYRRRDRRERSSRQAVERGRPAPSFAG